MVQHFKDVWNWPTSDTYCKNDINKIKKCIENNISIIRIYQPTINTTEWKQWLLTAIEYSKKLTNPMCIFPQNDSYNNHIQLCIKESISYSII